MAILTINAQAGEAYAALGIVPTQEGDVLVLTFQNGTRELWGLADEATAGALPYVELLNFSGRVYIQLPARES